MVMMQQNPNKKKKAKIRIPSRKRMWEFEKVQPKTQGFLQKSIPFVWLRMMESNFLIDWLNFDLPLLRNYKSKFLSWLAFDMSLSTNPQILDGPHLYQIATLLFAFGRWQWYRCRSNLAPLSTCPSLYSSSSLSSPSLAGGCTKCIFL